MIRYSEVDEATRTENPSPVVQAVTNFKSMNPNNNDRNEEH